MTDSFRIRPDVLSGLGPPTWGVAGPQTYVADSPGDGGPPPEPDAGGLTIDLRGPDAAAPVPPRDRTLARPSPGRYILEREIGRGGVGRVHRAWDCQLNRAVAIKVLREEHRDKPEAVHRFLEEARITSRLQHPGIVPIHDLGIAPDGRPFFVMRLVTGRSFEQFLRRRDGSAAELPRLLGIFLQVCQAIAYAHNQGVIHRDLKPANVMVGTFGLVKVMDWGLAKVLGEPDLPDVVSAARAAAELTHRCGDPPPAAGEPALPGTQIGTVFGTPAYLPPEQARGEIDRIDTRTDVFGLGSLLCQLLTGHPPYTGPSGRAIYDKAAAADLTEAVARLNACQAPLDVVSLAKWCLAPAPADRPATAGDVVEVMTAHMQAHQRRAEQDLVRFFDLTLDMFCIAGTDGYFHRVNENFSRRLGYPAAELTARPFIDFVHPDDRARTEAELVRLAAGEPCIQFLNRYRHALGHYLWLEWNAQAVLEERAVYAVARDVTDRVSRTEAGRTGRRRRGAVPR
ncbi:MAG TPA: protein kinase [Gemmataceae bacterium]|nr:protein kinase [Gemmataceae bacterium]